MLRLGITVLPMLNPESPIDMSPLKRFLLPTDPGSCGEGFFERERENAPPTADLPPPPNPSTKTVLGNPFSVWLISSNVTPRVSGLHARLLHVFPNKNPPSPGRVLGRKPPRALGFLCFLLASSVSLTFSPAERSLSLSCLSSYPPKPN